MPWYHQNTDWTKTDTPPDDGLGVQVHAPDRSERPFVRFQTPTDSFLLSGTDPRPGTDTTHTVAQIDPDTGAGTLLFTIHADGQDLVFEEEHSDAVADAVTNHVQSALNEILIPVYIDDVIEELSEKQSGLLALHTAQYETVDGPWTYFRTSLFEDETLLLEEEHGEI